MRPGSILRLLNSVKSQDVYPNEILVIDGSIDNNTENLLKARKILNLKYYKVENEQRGLTKQRNIGVELVNKQNEIICFLDDDIVLKPNYFKQIISTFNQFPDAIGVGGAIINEAVWKELDENKSKDFKYYYRDGYYRDLGARNVLRKIFGLLSCKPPGIMPKYSNGFSIGFYPPNGKTHQVEYFMGGVSGYKRSLFEKISFSEYFDGYGLYEDMEFCLRASRIGKLLLNTGAQCFHLHDKAGRPDYFKYGKMVVENGWIVWKLKYPNPDIKSILKWNAIVILLSLIRIKNGIINREKGALRDAFGRFFAWIKLPFKKPDYFYQKRKSEVTLPS